MVSRRARSLGLGFVASALLAVACGPSFQVVYEGDARFEHCYAIDDTPTVAMQEKTECWTQWMKSYTYGQTRNRVDYAAMRAKALQEAHAAPTDEAVMGAAPGGGSAAPVGVDEPLTTNAFATPPKTMNEIDGGRPVDAAPAPVVSAKPDAKGSSAPTTASSSVDNGPHATPAGVCTDACHAKWSTCRNVCTGRACPTCDSTYSGCMKSCF
jgi:hypothetical protein